MKITFEKIIIDNFKSFLHEEFDFSGYTGITLVTGKNMDVPNQTNAAGKSSLFDALLYVLFGDLQTGGKNRNLKNRYVPSKSTEMSVVLNFNIDGNKHFQITRGLSKYNTTFLQLLKKDSESDEYIDITSSTVKETEKYLEKEIFHFDKSLFLRTILFSSAQTYNFFMLSAGEKRDFLRKLFGIETFLSMHTNICKDKDKLLTDIKTSEEKIFSLNRYKQKSLNEQQTNTNIISEKISSLNKSIDNLKSELSLKKESYKQIEKVVSETKSTINSLNKSINDCTTKIHSYEMKRLKLNNEKDKLKTINSREEKRIEENEVLYKKLCSSCREIVSNYDGYQQTLDSVKQNNEKIAKIEQGILLLTNQIDELQKGVENSKESLTAEKSKFDEFVASERAVDLDIASIENTITSYEKQLTDYQKIIDNSNKILLQEIENDITKENERVDKINQCLQYLNIAAEIVSFDSLKKYLLSDLISSINRLMFFYLSCFGVKYICNFDENMDVSISLPDNGGVIDYQSFSSGERMRLSIALSLVFRDFLMLYCNFKSNLLIIDEFIDMSIDDNAFQTVLNLLADKETNQATHTMLVSHRISNEMFNQIDNVVEVKKENNISKITLLQ